jgi:tetratricopeptide (TPR) repeat protein
MKSRSLIAAKHDERTALAVVDRQPVYECVGLALIWLTTLVVYQPTFHGGMLMDDDGSITPHRLRPLSGLYHIWFNPTATAQYYPVLHTVFWLEHRLWGDSFFGYHLVTVLWHCIAVTLFYIILKRLKAGGALLAAAIFALHPVIVESVAWMTEQKNTLSTVFYLSAMLLYLKFDVSRQPSRYALALGLFVLALLTKSITVTLPAAMLVIFWWQRGRISWERDVLPLVPFFLIGAAFGVITICVEQTYFRGIDADFSLTFAQRILLAGRAIWFYASKLIWPVDLIFPYPRWTIDPTLWWQWTFPAAVLAMTLALWAIRGRWRAPLAGWLFFCGTLLPAIGLADFYMFVISFVADHLQYLASLGLIALAAAGIANIVRRLPQSWRPAGVAACILLLTTFAVLSRQQARLYGNVPLFYETVLARNPDSWLAHYNLGCELQEQGRPQEAAEHYREALRLRPDFAAAHRNLGGILADDGRHEEAMDEFRAVLALDPDDPQSLNGLGLALINTGHAEEAVSHLTRAIHLRPEFPQAHNNLGIALGETGKTAEAIVEFQRALELDQSYANPHNNWGIVLSRLGRNMEAIDHFRQSLRLNPDNANCQFNLAALLTQPEQVDEAISHLEQAIRLRPEFADAHFELAERFRQLNRFKQAIEHYQTALRLRPSYLEVHINLAKTLAADNRSAEAVAIATKGIDIARSSGLVATAEQLEEWLKHYGDELQHAADVAAPNAPASATERANSQ